MEFALSSTDYFWVGKLGPVAQDAVTSSMVVIWTMFASISIVSVGITALVSRYVGARQFDRAIYYIRQGLGMALALGLSFSIVGFLLTPAIINFMDASPSTSDLAVPYLRIFFMSTVFFFVAETGYAIFRASGDTRTPTKIGVMVVVINMLLDPLFIFGLGPLPAFGVPGASLATAIAIAAGAATTIALVSRGKLGFSVEQLHRLVPHMSAVRKIARIGIPMAGQQFGFVFVYWFLIKIVHQFGENAAAAMGIGNRMESFSYLTCYGISVAASTMVGQNLGAKQPERASRCAWGATGIALGLTALTSVVFLTIPDLIATVFTDNPEVKAIAVDYLIILGLSQTAMAIEIVLEGAFSGAGDTIPPLAIMLPGSAIRVPMAYYLAFDLGWGINGVWWTLTMTSILKAILLSYWFSRGKWKLKQV